MLVRYFGVARSKILVWLMGQAEVAWGDVPMYTLALTDDTVALAGSDNTMNGDSKTYLSLSARS